MYDQLCSGYLLVLSEVELQGKQTNLESLIYNHFENFELCQKAKHWWIGERNSSPLKKKVQMANLYCLIPCEDYFKSVEKFKEYLE